MAMNPPKAFTKPMEAVPNKGFATETKYARKNPAKQNNDISN